MTTPAGPNTPPTADGQVKLYVPTRVLAAGPGVALRPSVRPGPPPDRLYYVNGIQTDPAGHAATAGVLADLAERPVVGVYNATGGHHPVGFAADVVQCFADYSSIVRHAVTERVGVVVSAPVNAARQLGHAVHRLFAPDAPAPPQLNLLVDVHRLIPEATRVRLVEARLGRYNRATLSLYRELRGDLGRWQSVVAHSQGNLITSDALWAVVFSYGEAALDRVRVYSLASPAPAWPLGLTFRRKVYAHTNDAVTLLDPHNWRPLPLLPPPARPGGHFRQDGRNPIPNFGPHNVDRNIYMLNFANRLRSDHGLSPVARPVGMM